MVPERDRDYANTIAYALSSTRMQINDLNMQMTRYEGLADDVILEEIGMLREIGRRSCRNALRNGT